MDYLDDSTNVRGPWMTMFHELGHYIDHAAGRPSQSLDFLLALKSDFNGFVSNWAKTTGLSGSSLDLSISNYIIGLGHTSSGISDLFQGLSNYLIRGNWIHPTGYWNDSKIAKEAWAHFYSADYHSVSLVQIQKMFPSAYGKYAELLKVIL